MWTQTETLSEPETIASLSRAISNIASALPPISYLIDEAADRTRSDALTAISAICHRIERMACSDETE